MLAISREQLSSVETLQQQAFVQRALEHLREFFPQHLERAGDERAARFVRACMARAGEYGLVSEQQVGLFLNLAVAFGTDFDQRLPWARELLAGPGYGDPATRLELLYQAGLRQAEAAPPPRPASAPASAS